MLPPSIESRVAEAVYRLLTADPVLSGYFEEIRRCRTAHVFRDRWTAPALGVYAEASDEQRTGTVNRLETSIGMILVTRLDDDACWEVSDVAAQIKRVLLQDRGALREPGGERWLTEALTTFQRLDLGTPPTAGAYQYTILRAVLVTDVTLHDREVL